MLLPNAALKAAGKPPLDLSDRNQSQVWRFEMRLGSKQLRNRFEMRNWQDMGNTAATTQRERVTQLFLPRLLKRS
ncbi:hypothetical protein [Candidatus Halocynthiibacter alkanivorans]|uniref:hypothetical protein n=1 Tax=Candidatus Halocynthiibacter alkanivorans TaxID=2267619 RepID=UPI000DF27469|nr:hypothetical protein [Candidatus Halocynthiibacter alkanivorans]